MVRIVGIDLPKTKRIEYALTNIYGIGLITAKKIIFKLKINPNIRVSNLSDIHINQISELIESNYIVEGNLKQKKNIAYKRLIDIKCYRGQRHYKLLPVRGQRTKTNSKTRRTKVKKVFKKKNIQKEVKKYKQKDKGLEKKKKKKNK